MSKYGEILLISCLLLCPLSTMQVAKAESINDKAELHQGKTKTTDSQRVKELSENIIASGTFGSSDWYITDEGVLHIGSGTLGRASEQNPWEPFADRIFKIIFDEEVVANSNSSYLFGRLDKVVDIEGLYNLDTSKVTSMTGMFYMMSSLQSLDLSTFDTSNVNYMSAMFYRTSSLQSLDLSTFDTSNVNSMTHMFYNMYNLQSLDLSSFDTSKVTNMSAMFSGSPIRNLTLGSLFHFSFSVGSADLSIPDSQDPTLYTGKWINVGEGTVEEPKGFNIWTSAELMGNYKGFTDADTYVWQLREET